MMRKHVEREKARGGALRGQMCERCEKGHPAVPCSLLAHRTLGSHKLLL